MQTTEDRKPDPARIKYELERADYTQTDVARECKVLPTTVGAVIHGRSRSKKIETRIAAIVRMTPAELWPQWYGPTAKRRRRRPISTAQAAEALQAAFG